MKYRINGFDQIKAFYSSVFNNEHEFTPQHISLYVFLINQNNRNNWVEWFKCPFDLGMAGSCIGSKKTYYKCLDDLHKWGFISYERGTNEWRSPRIRIEVIKCTATDTATDTATVPQCEPLPIPLGVRDINHKQETKNIKPQTDFCEVEILENYPFSEFWELYDKKRGDKSKLEKKWSKIPEVERARIFEYLPKYKQANPDKKYRKDPETFLNNKSWNDEIIYSNGKSINNNTEPIADRVKAARARIFGEA